MIGGDLCKDEVGPQLIPTVGQELTAYEMDALWKIFQAIGRQWRDLFFKATDSRNLKSSWLDFIAAKTDSEPSYAGEYSSAVLCVDELIEEHGRDNAFYLLFLKNGIPKDKPPTTRLAHAKKYVIDEFIRVNVVASGFKSFGAPENRARNYKGYLGGSRYNLKARVREPVPSIEPTETKNSKTKTSKTKTSKTKASRTKASRTKASRTKTSKATATKAKR